MMQPGFDRPLTRSDRQQRLIGLSLVASPIVAAHWLAHSHQTSPLICPFHWLTGLPCPGCGLTRSFVAIARGDWPGAIDYHPFGPLLFGALLGLGLQWSVELRRRRRLVWPIGRSRWRIQANVTPANTICMATTDSALEMRGAITNSSSAMPAVSSTTKTTVARAA